MRGGGSKSENIIFFFHLIQTVSDLQTSLQVIMTRFTTKSDQNLKSPFFGTHCMILEIKLTRNTIEIGEFGFFLENGSSQDNFENCLFSYRHEGTISTYFKKEQLPSRPSVMTQLEHKCIEKIKLCSQKYIYVIFISSVMDAIKIAIIEFQHRLKISSKININNDVNNKTYRKYNPTTQYNLNSQRDPVIMWNSRNYFLV